MHKTSCKMSGNRKGQLDRRCKITQPTIGRNDSTTTGVCISVHLHAFMLKMCILEHQKHSLWTEIQTSVHLHVPSSN